MEEILKELNRLLGIVKQTHQDQLHHVNFLTSREDALKKGQEELAVKITEFAARESAFAGKERTENFIRETETMNQSLQEERAQLDREKKAFAILKSGSEGTLAESKKALDAAWVEVNKAKATVEKEVAKQLEEILSKIKKP